MKARLAHLTGGRTGETAVVWKSCAMLGRSPQADVRFGPDGDRMVAARHAALAWHDGVWTVRDLGGTNGTFVDGSRVHGETALRDGSIIQLGPDGPQVRFSVIWESGAPEPVRTVDVDAPDDPDAFRAVPHTPVILSRPDRDERPLPSPHRGGIRRGAVVIALVVAVLGGITLAGAGPDNSPEALRASLLLRADSLFGALEAIPTGDAVMLGAIAETESNVARLRGRMRRAPADPVALSRLADSLGSLSARAHRLAGVAALDVPGVVRGGTPAIALVEARLADGRRVTATAYAVRGADGRVHFLTGSPEIAALPATATLRVLLRDDSAGIPMRVEARHDHPRISVLASAGTHTADAALGRRAPFPAAGEAVVIVESTPSEDRAAFVETRTAAAAVVSVQQGVARLERLGGEAAAGSAIFDRHGAMVGLVLPEDAGYGVRAVPVTVLLAPTGERAGG
jgi:pSer/pThr/pTyr-binding forkhead associated (FHA) protein